MTIAVAPADRRRAFTLLAGLTLVAGYSDALAFFGLGVFTANMTGNTVLLGGALAVRAFPHLPIQVALWPPVLSLGAFVLAALVAAAVLRGERGRPALRTRGVMIAVVLLLGGAALLFHVGPASHALPAIALLSGVMGVQSVVAVRAGVPGVSTTYVTGTLVTAMVDLFGTAPTPERRRAGATNVAAWGLYLLGALLGTAALGWLGDRALWVPAAVVALLLPML